jgi:NhaP-type Na+/H+ or K+/H+ antiporter
MRQLETLLGLVLAAVVLAALARRVRAPYPVFLALGGALLAFVPGAPAFTVPPELALALFIAPVLLDAAYDASLRDLKDNWVPIASLVLFAVGLTTVAVAIVAHTLVPEMPWAAAIALGAVVAPPDAAAATAVLRPMRPPHRILTILEGESLLNDASALLIFRLAVGAVAANGFYIGTVAPTFLLAVAGSLVAGSTLGWIALRLMGGVQHVPTVIILQFVSTFGVWILADHVGLSGVLTMVCYAVTLARSAPERTPARVRIPSYAVWETVVFVLNILAFIFIGLQIRPIFESLDARPCAIYQRRRYGPPHRHHRARGLAHVLQYSNQMARPPVRVSSATADVAANYRERLDYFVGRHAGNSLARGSDGAPIGVSVSRPDRADGVRCRARYPRDPGTDTQASLARAQFA